MTEDTSLLTFPCDFPIKIIGDHTADFVDSITNLIKKYYPDTADEKITHKPSVKGNFVSVTATVHCLDKDTLDELYRALTGFPGIRMVL